VAKSSPCEYWDHGYLYSHENSPSKSKEEFRKACITVSCIWRVEAIISNSRIASSV
jgi:hypothetical protein